MFSVDGLMFSVDGLLDLVLFLHSSILYNLRRD